MPDPTDHPHAVAWLAPDQAPGVRAVAEACGLRITSAGSPEKGKSGGVADTLGAEPIDDLRSAFAAAEADLILITSPGSFGAGDGPDAQSVLGARERGVRIASLEPVPASALELGGGGWTRSTHGVRPIDAIRVAPMMGFGRSWRDAADAIENFGPVRTLHVEALGRPEHGSLGARLHSAMGLVHARLGMPEMIYASSVGPIAGVSRTVSDDSLRNLHGDVSAVLRYADGRAASIVASNQSPAWDHSALMLGEEGRLRITDDSMRWDHLSAEEPDEQQVAWAPALGQLGPFERALADAIARLLDPRTPADVPVDHASVLAMSQAALLSARTGQGESADMIRKLAIGE
ncbi:MAG: hypothetical protein ACIARR_01240 [Phycisphaerales bacterium JB059]